MIYLLQELDEAFKIMTGYSLTESEKSAELIRKKHRYNHDSNSDEDYPSARFLRDYWPSLVKSKKKEDYNEKKGKPRVDTTPRTKKLNLIAKCAGYFSWEAFCNITRRRIITENTYFDPKDFKIEKMTKNDPPIIIGWYPQYFMKLQYLGNYDFKVLSYSHNLRCKYKKDEVVKIYGFEVRYVYEVARSVGLIDENTDRENENSKKDLVGGCPLRPELVLMKEKGSSIEENTSAFIVRS